MSEDSGLDGAVVVVDPERQLTAVVESLRRGGIEDVRHVKHVEDTPNSPTCIIVPHDTGTADGVAALDRVRDRYGDVPVGVYALDQDRETLRRLLTTSADTILRVPPERSAVLVERVRHLVGVAETESLTQQYESLLAHYPQAVYLKDPSGRFVNMTAYAFGSFDDALLEREQVVGLSDYELYDQELADRLFEEEQELLAREEGFHDKIEHYVEDGEDRWVATTKVPRYDDEGALLGLVGDVKDVTAIKRQERMMATLHEASRQLVRAESKREVGRTAVDIATEMDSLPLVRVDLFDPETDVLDVVAAVGEEIGWDDDSFRRAAAGTLYRTPTGEFVPVDIDDHDHTELELPEEVDAVSGLRIPLGEHGVFGVDTGAGKMDPFTIELAHVLASNVEAALDRAEQQRQLTEQAERLEEFAALGSHELRNRLQIAMGTAERARAQEDLGAVDSVIETLGRMNRLVSQLLTLARTGSVTRGTESLALSGIAETAWAAVDSPRSELSVDGDGIITADRDGLLEVLEILFRTTTDSGDSNAVRVGTLPEGFYVESDGTAIPPDQQAELFEPTYSEVDGETGDSVYLVAVIADAHDWTVDISTSDSGTRFSFASVDIAHVQE